MLLALIIVLSACLLLSCGNDNSSNNDNDNTTHTHKYGEWTSSINASCSAEGQQLRRCDCGETESRVVDKLEHSYKTTYTFDDAYHWFACANCDATKDKATHTSDSDGNCTVCGISIYVAEGVIYGISEDGTYARVVAYCGAAAKVKIASEYKGLPVNTIYREAFRDNDTITDVIIHDSITSIGYSAFAYCSSLASVTIGDSVTSIGGFAFLYCDSLTGVIIPNSVTSIGPYAFCDCDSLTSVTISDSVTSIGDYAFDSCASLTDVYYTGTEEDWAKISIGDWNYDLTNATIHYNYVLEE